MPSALNASTTEEPIVSVVIPAFNAEEHIGTAIRCVMAQTISRVEVIVIDDGSTDLTATIVEQEAEADQRVRHHRLDKNSGVSAARNRGFELARGEWIAVLDSDDLMAPDRLERLINEGDRHDAQIVADNPARFASLIGPVTPVLATEGDFAIDAEHYLRANMFFQQSLHYGLLKPLLRAKAVWRSGQKYNEQLRIAEDDDFYLRLLLKDQRFHVHASTYYFYRQHPRAVTRHVGAQDVALMTVASGQLLSEFTDHPLRELIRQRRQAFERASDYLHLIAALKAGQISQALRIAYRRPSSLPLLQTPLRKALGKVLGSTQKPAGNEKLRKSLHEALRLAGDPLASPPVRSLELYP